MLKLVEARLGNQVTYMDQLQKAGDLLIGPKFKGVVMLDEIPILRPGESVISNTDKASQRGKHWVAVQRGTGLSEREVYVYDSFGRAPGSLMPGALKRAGGGVYGWIDKDSEQKINENNCGQRCITWLLFAQKYGLELAKMI